jgi:hypothetical protein
MIARTLFYIACVLIALPPHAALMNSDYTCHSRLYNRGLTMKRIANALLVLACFTGGAIASTNSTTAKIQRFADPALCYLEVAVIEKDAQLVRSELQRRDLVCTPELRVEGRQVLEHTVRLANLQTVSTSIQRATAAREIRERREIVQSFRCATQGGQSSAGCPGF